jgi:hypothetical protein
LWQYFNKNQKQQLWKYSIELKQQCLYVWAVPGRFFQSLPVPCGVYLSVVTNKAGQGSQGSRCGGPGEVPFLLKKSLGKTGGPASNQTKMQFFKNYFHYRTY